MAEKKIEGELYSVPPVLATTAVQLQIRLVKVLGSGIDRLPLILAGAAKDASPEKKEEANNAAIAAFNDIFVKADPDEMTKLIKDVVELAQIKRPSGVFDTVDLDADFTQNKSALIPVVVFVVREVFGDFFSGLLGNGSLGGVLKG